MDCMIRLRHRLTVWGLWCSGNVNGRLHQILVLLGLVKSPTFEVLQNMYHI